MTMKGKSICGSCFTGQCNDPEQVGLDCIFVQSNCQDKGRELTRLSISQHSVN